MNFPDDILWGKEKHVRMGSRQGNHSVTDITGYPIFFHTLKSTHFVEINVTELRLLDHLAVKSSFELHHQEEHMIVRTTWKQYFACVEFVQSATNGPYIQG